MEEQQTQNSSPAPQSGQSDADKNKPIAIIGYILPFLFFIPLITDAKDSPFAKFHASQQLNLLLAGAAVWVIGFILAITIILAPLSFLLWIAYIVFQILGVINAAKGEMKPLPVIGGFNIIK